MHFGLFRSIRVALNYWDFLGMMNSILIDVCPWGLEVVVGFLRLSVVRYNGLCVINTQGMSHMIDDFFFIGKQGSQSCVQDLSQFISLCSDIGVPIKHEKTVLPSTVITIYGIEIDSVAMECRLPNEKVEKIREKLQYFVKKKKVTLTELRSL